MSEHALANEDQAKPDTESSSSPRRYMTLSQARQFLGVSDTTLRDWTDAGKIKAFITPGGHRRYAESDLREFMEAQPHIKRLPDLIQQLKTVRVEYQLLTQEYTRTRPWYSKLDESVRSGLRMQCALLLDLILSHLSVPNRRPDTAAEAKKLGRQMGIDLSRLDFSLTDAIEAFILYRNPTLDTVAELLKSNEPVDRSVIRGIQAIHAIIDNVLLGIVEQYQAQNDLSDPGLVLDEVL